MEQVLTTDEVKQVQQSYAILKPNAEDFGNQFYANLFKHVPDAAKLFPPSNPHQTIKLMLFLETGINTLHEIEKVAPLLRDLGERHVHYGVVESHYVVAEDALVDTLKQYLGDDFSAELETAWRHAYQALTFYMRDAAKNVQPAKPKGFFARLFHKAA